MKLEGWLVNFHSLGTFCMDISNIFCNLKSKRASMIRLYIVP